MTSAVENDEVNDDYCCGFTDPYRLQHILDNSDHHHPDTIAAIKSTLRKSHGLRRHRETQLEEFLQRAQNSGQTQHPQLHEFQPNFHDLVHEIPSGDHVQSFMDPARLQHMASSEHNDPRTREAARRTQEITARLQSQFNHQSETARNTAQAPPTSDTSSHQPSNYLTAIEEGDISSEPFEMNEIQQRQDMSLGAEYSSPPTALASTDNSVKLISTDTTTSPAPITFSKTGFRLYRVACTADNTNTIPGTRKAAEDDSPPELSDPDVANFWDHSRIVFSFLWNCFQRNGVGNDGRNMIGTVHVEKGFCNAMWSGNQMAFGDGDGIIFNSFASCPDVTGHEYGHGIIGATTRLPYKGQSGALNESFADVFGLLVKMQHLRNFSRDQCDWLLGKELFKDGKSAMRSLKDPGKCPSDSRYGPDTQVQHWRDYKRGDYDNGYVHANSGIPNKAFYNFCHYLGDNGKNLAMLPAYTWFYAFTNTTVRVDPDFSDFAEYTSNTAKWIAEKNKLDGTKARAQCLQAWADVGVKPKIIFEMGADGNWYQRE